MVLQGSRRGKKIIGRHVETGQGGADDGNTGAFASRREDAAKETAGGARVVTKDGTTMGDLPWDDAKAWPLPAPTPPPPPPPHPPPTPARAASGRAVRSLFQALVIFALEKRGGCEQSKNCAACESKPPIVEAVAVATAAEREAGGEAIAACTACTTVAMNSADAIELAPGD